MSQFLNKALEQDLLLPTHHSQAGDEVRPQLTAWPLSTSAQMYVRATVLEHVKGTPLEYAISIRLNYLCSGYYSVAIAILDFSSL